MRPARGGYVLLTVLVLLTLAALALAGLARKSLLLAEEASTAQRDLQRRWGTISGQHALLWRAEAMLEWEAVRRQYAADPDDPPPALPKPDHIVIHAMLGKIQFTFRLADEGAKVNLNTVYLRQGESRVMAMVRSLGGLSRSVHLRPNPRDNKNRFGDPFESWGQVFAQEKRGRRNPTAETLLEATTGLTCWSQGRVNLCRAPDELIAAVCQGTVNQRVVDELLELRAAADEDSAESLVDRLAVRERQRVALKQLFTTTSQCFSLWITAQDGPRRFFALSVAESRMNARPVVRSFRW